MKERISALMDGELDEQAAEEVIGVLGRDRTALETWRLYHVISDAIGENQPLPRAAQPRRWIALPIAASLAAVSLVGWLAFAPQQEARPLVAQVPPAPAALPPVVQATPAVPVPLPSAVSDYLLAHQGFSPRVSFQGMAPYVRSVSAEAREARR